MLRALILLVAFAPGGLQAGGPQARSEPRDQARVQRNAHAHRRRVKLLPLCLQSSYFALSCIGHGGSAKAGGDRSRTWEAVRRSIMTMSPLHSGHRQTRRVDSDTDSIRWAPAQWRWALAQGRESIATCRRLGWMLTMARFGSTVLNASRDQRLNSRRARKGWCTLHRAPRRQSQRSCYLLGRRSRKCCRSGLPSGRIVERMPGSRRQRHVRGVLSAAVKSRPWINRCPIV